MECTDFAADWHKWSTGQGHVTIDFRGQEVRGQGYMMLKLVLEAWQWYHSLPVQWSRFSSSSSMPERDLHIGSAICQSSHHKTVQ